MKETTTITINGNVYKLPKINYHAMVRLEDLGFDLNKVQEKMFKTYAAAVALTTGTDLDEAMDTIEAHCENGGNLTDFAPIIEHIATSDFFTTLMGKKTANEETK